MSSTKQSAFAITGGVGAPGPWKLIERDIPKPNKGDVLVKIKASALNPVDWKVQKYGIFLDMFGGFPAVQGSDIAGDIAGVGEGVTNFAEGDRVVLQGLFSDNDKAGFQQYVVAPAEIVSKLPASISYDQAASIPLGLATGAVGLFNPQDQGGLALTPSWTAEGKGKYSGQSIVILGGSSSVGQYTIQLARESGFSPIITTSSLKHTELLKSLGATHVIDRNGDVVPEIKSILKNGTTDIVYDSISDASTQAVSVQVLSANGNLILTLPLDASVKAEGRKVFNFFGNVHVQRALGVSLYKALHELLANGTIKPNNVEVIPGGLPAIQKGLDRMEANKVSGVKLIVHPFE